MKTKIIIGMFLLGLLFCATHKTKDIIEIENKINMIYPFKNSFIPIISFYLDV